uniref:Uncharacterized protein LOC111099572 isoform X1 n=1 Tax=Crassostrea virginica TaxID=6565 RepID=A0A8B8A7I2_CRAVI|nr:uncharacterized protein LOC111099572 isoform X1 [Crassostrea virginica]
MPRGDRGGKSKGSGIRCVAANCGNTNTDGVSLHTFPKDAALRKKWTDFVKLKRGAWVGPTEYSALCSAHFSADCFPFRQRFEMEQMGIKPKKVTLNPDAVPTIHALTPPPSISSPSATSSSTPKRSPYKRPFNMLSPNEEEQCQSSPPKKIRRGYTKRETNRILTESLMMSQTTDSDEETLAIPMDVPTEPEETYSEWKKSVGCQFNYHPKHRSKYCQTSIKENHKKMVSVGTQTEFEKKIIVDAFANVTPRSFEKPINRNILGSISSMDDPVSSPIADDSNDESYCPTDSDQSSDNYEDELDDRLRSPQDQKKFFVFEENLMELFSRCRNCSAKTTGKVRHVIGSMIKIQQVCEVCEFTYHWQSQPVVAGKPAGNLIMSAGILFSGALPSKVLRMYKFCKIACISNSTFMNHQKYYLFPSISHVWSNFQHDYFNDVKLDGRAVVLGGDGRADTPGHSAKFGCYSVVDLD